MIKAESEIKSLCIVDTITQQISVKAIQNWIMSEYQQVSAACLSAVFRLMYQKYLSWFISYTSCGVSINYIHSVNKKYISLKKKFSEVLVLPKIRNPCISPTWVQWVEFKGGITNYPQSVDRAPGARDLTVTIVGERNTVEA